MTRQTTSTLRRALDVITAQGPKRVLVHAVRTCVCLVALALLCPLLALGQLRSTQWNADSGLPQNGVRGIVQTPDGYLWIATLNGVARFDGVRFTVFDKSNTPAMSSNRFVIMIPGQDGDLWLASEDSSLIRYHDRRFQRLGEGQGVLPNSIVGLASDDKGSVWTVTENAIFRWSAQTGRFEVEQRASAGERYHSFRWNGYGFWKLHGRDLDYFIRGQFHRVPLPESIVSDDIKTFAIDEDGTIWVALKHGNVSRTVGGRFQRPQREITIQASTAADGEHGTAIHVRALLNRYIEVLLPNRVRSEVLINTMMTDREGNVWIGSEMDGLFRFQKQSISIYSTSQGLAAKEAYLVLAGKNGDMWVGTWPEGLSRIRDGKVRTFRAHDGLTGYLSALAEDHRGNIWIGSHGGIQLLTRHGIRSAVSLRNVTIPPAWAIYEMDDGTMVFGTSHGVYVVNGGQVRVMSTREGLATDDARTIIKDRHGDIWIGGYGGVTQLSSALIPKARWTERDGLPSGSVRTIHEDSKGNIWIGTYDGGLGLLRGGKWTVLNAAHGLFDNGVFQILEDRRHTFWMSSNHGIYRVSKEDLDAFAEGKETRVRSIGYGQADGLSNVECNGGLWPSGAIDRRGFLWFPTQDGVAVIDPDKIAVSRQAIQAVIESVSIDHTNTGETTRVVLYPGQSDLEIQYTALSFVKPEQIEFRYKLDGIDHDWEFVGRRRTAYYTHLQPGRYVFHVRAVDSDGVWSQKDECLEIEVVPRFFERWWFRTGVALALFGAVWSFWSYRIRQLELAQAAQKAFSQQLIASQETERRRMAAELHDGLSQRLVVIKNLALLALKARGEHVGEELRRSHVEEISFEASAAMDEARSMLYALRPFQLERVGLSRALQGLVQTAERASGIAFTVELKDLDSAFLREQQINAFRIVQESVNNIIKHSGATAASIVSKNDDAELHLLISDNGRGFGNDIQGSATGGFGLEGIRERVDLLGGTLHIASQPGSGTQISMKFPIQRAT